ncbi:right-handed parallel beta-helix repeat-containing protein [Parasalinivibrio latis]|uniref:right-handed parallel beta-helix repeat-containing protein n=1 Tax=Parasalinivibrio latis TaxID=2952610 RepID=UPI003DA58BD6
MLINVTSPGVQAYAPPPDTGGGGDDGGGDGGGDGSGNGNIPDNTVVVDGKEYKDFAAAVSAITDKSIVEFGPGEYTQGITIRHNEVTLRGSQGTHFKGAQVQGKGTFVVAGDNVRIERIECSNVAVRDQNGACVRQEGKDLVLDDVYFHTSEQGLLSAKGSGSLLITNSTFSNLGKNGRAHGIYSNNDTLTIRNSTVKSAKSQGHEVKSRASVTNIESSTIASVGGQDSRLLDIPNGGALRITHSVLQQGPNSVNRQLIGFGLEPNYDPLAMHVVEIQDTVIILERNGTNEFLALPKTGTDYLVISIEGNDFIGEFMDKGNLPQSNNFYPDRATYGLGPYPNLPTIGE